MSDPLTTNDRVVVQVKTPEWHGAEIFVRSLSCGEQIDLDNAQEAAATDQKKILALQLAAYVCDGSGKPVWNQEQAAQLLNRRTAPIYRILKAAKKLNAWDKDEQEEIRGNS
jgi:hypothetical protein